MTYHPVETTVNGTDVPLARMKVGNKVDIEPSSGSHGVDIKTISGKGRGKWSIVDEKLRRQAGILLDLLANSCSIAGAPPVEVKRNEDLHTVTVGRVVCVAELLVGVPVNTDVEGKGIDTCSFGALHIIVIVARATSITDNANLVVDVSSFSN